MCQTKIHGGQEKMEGMRIRVSVGANACTRAYPFAVMRRCMGSRADKNKSRADRNRSCADENRLCADGNGSRENRNGLLADGNGSRAHTSWSHANTSKNSENFGRSYLPQNLSNRAFEVIFGIYRKCRCQKHLKHLIWISFE